MPTTVKCKQCSYILYQHKGIPEEYRTRHSTLPEIVWKLHNGECPMSGRAIPANEEWKSKMTIKLKPLEMTRREVELWKLRHSPHLLKREKQWLKAKP